MTASCLQIMEFLLNSPSELEILLFDGLILITPFKLSLILFLLFIIILWIIPLTGNEGDKAESYILILANIIGIISFILSNDLILTLLGWELFNLSLYLLLSLNQSHSHLSSLFKYFIISALSTSILITGILIIYIELGSTNYSTINILKFYHLEGHLLGPFFIMLSLLLKLGVAPLHNYVIDLYEKAPLHLTFYMFIIPKFSIINLMIIIGCNNDICKIFGVLSFVMGSIGLFYQFNLQRFLAFSGLTHLGFILLANESSGYISYLLIYCINLLGLYLIFRKNITISHYYYSNFPLYLAITILLLSLAGLPPLLGFFAKYII